MTSRRYLAPLFPFLLSAVIVGVTIGQLAAVFAGFCIAISGVLLTTAAHEDQS